MLPLVTGDAWPGEPGAQGNAGVLTLMKGVALEMGLLVLELIWGPTGGWGVEGLELPGH